MWMCDANIQNLNSYYEDVRPFRDEYNIITQKDFGGGDGMHRTTMFYYGLYLQFKDNGEVLAIVKKDYDQLIQKFKVEDGVFVRHPDPTKWYSNPNNFSRDQTIPMIISMGAFGDHDKDIKSNLWKMVKRGGFYPNELKNWTNEKKHFPEDYNDIASLADYGTYIRSLKAYWAYPILFASDLFHLGSSIIRVGYSFYTSDDTSDDLNLTANLLQAKEIMPTPVSEFASWIYSFKNVHTFPGEKLSNLGIQSAWDYYFNERITTRPPVNNAYKCIIAKRFYNEKQFNLINLGLNYISRKFTVNKNNPNNKL